MPSRWMIFISVIALFQIHRNKPVLGKGLNRPGFRRHLAAINYGLGGGGYEHEAVHR